MSQMGCRGVWLWNSKLGKGPSSRTQGPAGLPPFGAEMLEGRRGLLTPLCWQLPAVPQALPHPGALVCSLLLPAGRGRDY